MSNKGNKAKRAGLLASLLVTVGATAFSGCSKNQIPSSSKITNVTESSVNSDEVRKVYEIMNKCEELAAGQIYSDKDVIDKLKGTIREHDSEGYTAWTNPDGELHQTENRKYYDAVELAEMILNGQVQQNEDGIYIIPNYTGNNVFINNNNGEVKIAYIKNYMVSPLEAAINQYLINSSAEFRISYESKLNMDDPLPMDPELLALKAGHFSVLDTKYEPISRSKLNDYEKKIAQLAENLFKCIILSDSPKEVAKGVLNATLLFESADDKTLQDWILRDGEKSDNHIKFDLEDGNQAIVDLREFGD